MRYYTNALLKDVAAHPDVHPVLLADLLAVRPVVERSAYYSGALINWKGDACLLGMLYRDVVQPANPELPELTCSYVSDEVTQQIYDTMSERYGSDIVSDIYCLNDDAKFDHEAGSSGLVDDPHADLLAEVDTVIAALQSDTFPVVNEEVMV